MEEEIAGFEQFYGRTLKPELQKNHPSGNGVQIITRPDHYKSWDMHINMYIIFDNDYKLVSVKGDKCYSKFNGMWNRSGPAKERNWSKKDIAYLKKYINSITE